MKQLESLLQDIPEQERVEAIQYYDDYFEDAGEENEQAVMESLGSPAKVAENIKNDLSRNRYNYGMEEERVVPGKEIVKYYPEVETVQQTSQETKKEGLSTGIIVLIVLLCILASPVLLGVLGALFGIVIAWAALVVSFGAVAIVLIAAAVVVAVVGIIGMVTKPLTGIGIVGAGFILAAVGLVFLMLTVLLVWAVIALIKGLVKLCSKSSSKNKTA